MENKVWPNSQNKVRLNRMVQIQNRLLNKIWNLVLSDKVFPLRHLNRIKNKVFPNRLLNRMKNKVFQNRFLNRMKNKVILNRLLNRMKKVFLNRHLSRVN